MSRPAERSPTETILVAEDALEVLALVRAVLEAEGYTTLAAADGEEALRVAERHPGPIHGLLADVVMPKVSGPELADRLARARPDMKVVFMSGYTTEVIGEYGLLPSGVRFLGKPFTPAVLLRRLREALDHRSPFARSAAPSRPALT